MSTYDEREEMKKRILIAIGLLATPFIFSKVLDVHVPTSEEFYLQEMHEKNRENQKAFDTIYDEKSTEEDKSKAYETLLNNGAMA